MSPEVSNPLLTSLMSFLNTKDFNFLAFCHIPFDFIVLVILALKLDKSIYDHDKELNKTRRKIQRF